MPKPLLGYYGGKGGPVGAWIAGQLPPHSLYVEPFGGMAGVLMQKRASRVEVYNDRADELVNLMRVVRDQPEQLRELLLATFYAKAEYDQARRLLKQRRLLLNMGVSPLEWARCTYVVLSQSRDNSLIGKGFSFGGAAFKGSVADTFVNGQARIPEISERLRRVMIENHSWQTVCRQHDGRESLFYLDPPYKLDTRVAKDGYVYEMSDAEHEELLHWCLTATGAVLLSGYRNKLYQLELERKGWLRRDFATVANSSASRQKKTGAAARVESLWLNPLAAAATPTLFCNQGKEVAAV